MTPAGTRTRGAARDTRSVLRPADLVPTGTIGLRSRKLRACLSALGIAIGIASIVSVLGITRSSQSDLLAQLDRLGTNLLTVAGTPDPDGTETPLPLHAGGMVALAPHVLTVAPTTQLTQAHVYVNDRVPAGRSGGLVVRACDPGLLRTLDGALLHGRFLDAGAYPVTVLGADAATTLGVTGVGGRVWLGRHWFTVAGILRPMPFAPEIDRSALVSFPAAAALLEAPDRPTRLYVRADPDHVTEAFELLAPAASPAEPAAVTAYRPSDALVAQLAVKQSAASLVLGLGAVALLVGAIGIANVMVVAVLERRGEIGLRRALGATRGHIAAQFLTESVVLSALGGLAGLAIGVAVTAGVATDRGWAVLVPAAALWSGLGVALAAGVVAGIYPAVRAARVPPADALRTV